MEPSAKGISPTFQDLARAAEVSSMTVSRALSGRGRIAEATRTRILRLADRLGYRPDPEIAKLMHHLRNRRTHRFQSVIVGLTTREIDDRENYFCSLTAAARTQVVERGYGFEIVNVATDPERWPSLHRTLLHRGVEGVLLLPQKAPIDLTPLLAWEKFSVVSASASAIGPSVHRVMPHHFANTLLLCRNLASQGHRRIGLVMTAEHDRRSENSFTAAVTWHGLNESAHFIPPLITSTTSIDSLRAWFTREKPDAIITNEIQSARDCARLLGKKLAGPPRFVVTSLHDGSHPRTVTGINERPATIGAAAADLLTSMVERRVRGCPTAPASTLLTGCWVG